MSFNSSFMLTIAGSPKLKFCNEFIILYVEGYSLKAAAEKRPIFVIKSSWEKFNSLKMKTITKIVKRITISKNSFGKYILKLCLIAYSAFKS